MLIAQAKKQPISWDICPFHHYIGTFWYLDFKKFHGHPEIIPLDRLLRCEIVKIWKIHWKLMFLKSQYCFANISTTEARILMKFYMVVNYYLVNLSFKFHEDPWTNARARFVSTRIRDKTCAHTFTTHYGTPCMNIKKDVGSRKMFLVLEKLCVKRKILF